MKIEIVFFCCFLVGIDSALLWEPQDEIPDHPNQCYDEDKKHFYEKDEIMPNENNHIECSQKVCTGKYAEEEGQVLIRHESCGRIAGKPLGQIKTCNVTATLGAYPKCCVHYEIIISPDCK